MAEEMMQSYSTVDLRDKLRQRGFFENLGAQLGYQYSPAVAKTTEFLLFNDEERDPDFDGR